MHGVPRDRRPSERDGFNRQSERADATALLLVARPLAGSQGARKAVSRLSDGLRVARG